MRRKNVFIFSFRKIFKGLICWFNLSSNIQDGRRNSNETEQIELKQKKERTLLCMMIEWTYWNSNSLIYGAMFPFTFIVKIEFWDKYSYEKKEF